MNQDSYSPIHKISELKDALYYLSVSELKAICTSLQLCAPKTKSDLIELILYFIQHGKTPTPTLIPKISLAQKNVSYPLKPETLILKGSYKNDLQTRLFMKKLVGSHFHFTAYGIDWIKDRWLLGKPPTYQEFADYWEQERKSRLLQPAKAKKEWAYINFTQQYLKKMPHASKKQIIIAWNEVRFIHKKRVETFLISRSKNVPPFLTH